MPSFSILLVSLLASVANARSSGFLSHCDKNTLVYQNRFDNPDYHKLAVTCGGRVAKIDLNRCITNHNGLLQWDTRSANYAASCIQCFIQGTDFSCKSCFVAGISTNNGPVITLNDGIGYVNGQLVCTP